MYLFIGYEDDSQFIVPQDSHFFTKLREIVAAGETINFLSSE